LEINVEDLAEIVLEFVNGAVGSIHLNMVQRAPSRSCRAIGTEGVLVWDGITQEVRLYSAKEQTWTVLYTATVVDRNEMYLAELQHFLECVRSGKEAEVGGNEGKRVVEIALAVFQSSQERRSVAV
jgi:predicted dehydrogenase